MVETNSVKKKAGTVEISVKALKNTTLQNSGSLGSVPEGFRPSHEVCLSAVAWTATGVPYSASVSIGTDGLIRFYQSGSNSRWLIFHTSYMVLLSNSIQQRIGINCHEFHPRVRLEMQHCRVVLIVVAPIGDNPRHSTEHLHATDEWVAIIATGVVAIQSNCFVITQAVDILVHCLSFCCSGSRELDKFAGY